MQYSVSGPIARKRASGIAEMPTTLDALRRAGFRLESRRARAMEAVPEALGRGDMLRRQWPGARAPAWHV
jgi:hypothetical protein